MARRIGVFSIILALAMTGAGLPTNAFAQETGGDSKDVFRSQVDLVSVYFTVRDSKKRLADDLEQSRFRVYEDGREQSIKFFAHHSDVVLNVGVLLDTGTNMSWILGEEAEASALFMEHVVRPTDLGFILSYAARVETIQVPTSDTELLKQQVAGIRSRGTEVAAPDQAPPPPAGLPFPGGGTIGINGQPLALHREAHLYDAIRVSTLRYLRHEVGRKAVVVVALSGDSKSESSMEDALEALLENDVIAYVLQIYDAPHARDRCD